MCVCILACDNTFSCLHSASLHTKPTYKRIHVYLYSDDVVVGGTQHLLVMMVMMVMVFDDDDDASLGTKLH